MIEPRQQAPGCFGAASVYSMDSEVCQGCVAFKECGDEAFKTLDAIKAVVNVDDILRRHQAARKRAADARPKPTPVESSPIPVAQPKPITKPIVRKTATERVTFTISEPDQAALMKIGERSSKTQAQAIVLCKQNKIDAMREDLPKGINPFAESGPKFMRVVCDMVINGGFTKASLKARLMQEFDWTDGTAGSHVAMSCAMMFGFGICKVADDKFVLNPALTSQNIENKKVSA